MYIRMDVTLVYPIYPPLFAFQPKQSLEASCLLPLLVWARGWGEHCFVYFGKPLMNMRVPWHQFVYTLFLQCGRLVIQRASFRSSSFAKRLPARCSLTLIVPRAWDIGFTQPCILCQRKTATHFVYFWSRKTLPYTHLEAISFIPQLGQSLHIWNTSLSTIGYYKNKYTIQFL